MAPTRRKPECAYMRDYIWNEMKKWLAHAAIGKDPALSADLAKPLLVSDKKQRIKLESKEEMIARLRKLGIKSGIARRWRRLACTFAMPVAPARKPSCRPARPSALPGDEHRVMPMQNNLAQRMGRWLRPPASSWNIPMARNECPERDAVRARSWSGAPRPGSTTRRRRRCSAARRCRRWTASRYARRPGKSWRMPMQPGWRAARNDACRSRRVCRLKRRRKPDAADAAAEHP